MKDVIIVGGGLYGLLTARRLQQEGLDSLLIDQNVLGREASWAGSGIISPLKPWQCDNDVQPLVQQTQQQFAAFCDELKQETGIDPEYEKTGLLILENDSTEQEKAKDWAQQNNATIETSVAKTCESLLEKTTNSLYFSDIANVRNTRLLHALKASLHLKPNMIAEHVPVTQLLHENNKIIGVQLGSRTIQAKQVLVTSGAWANQLPELNQLSLQPQRSQTLLFRGEPNVLNKTVVSGDSTLTPRRDGRILFSQPLAKVGFDKTTTETMFNELRQQALELMPSLENVRIRNHWIGIHAQAPKPMIQPHEQIEGLHMNIGHGELGMAMCLSAVEQSVQQLLS